MEQEVEEFEGFLIMWDPKGHFVNFEVHLDDELYTKGYVKWDGCTEIQDMHHHWCGGPAVSAHIKLIAHLYDQAFEFMTSCQVDDPLTITITEK